MTQQEIYYEAKNKRRQWWGENWWRCIVIPIGILGIVFLLCVCFFTFCTLVVDINNWIKAPTIEREELILMDKVKKIAKETAAETYYELNKLHLDKPHSETKNDFRSSTNTWYYEEK